MNIIINDILIDVIKQLSVEEAGSVFLNLYGKNLPLSPLADIVFKRINFDTLELKRKRAIAGKKGGAPKGNTNAKKLEKNKQKQAKQAKVDLVVLEGENEGIKTSKTSIGCFTQDGNIQDIAEENQEFKTSKTSKTSKGCLVVLENNDSPSPYKERILNNQDSQLSNTQVFKLNETNSLLFKENKNLNKTLNNISLVSLHTTQAHTHTHAHEENAQNETVFSSPNDNGKESAEKEKSSAKKEKEQAQFVVDKFNQICKSFSPVRTLTDARVRHINNRLAEMEKVAAQENKSVEDILNELLNNLEQSSFLKGDNSRGWKADFNWLFSYKGNWVKVLEGNYKHTNLTEYDNTRGHTTTTFTHRKWINPRLQENEERREMVKRGITKREYTKEDEEREEANIARLLGRHAAMVREVTKATTDLLTANSKEDKQTDGGY